VPPERIPVAVIGAGNITSLRHIPALRASRRVDVLGIVDRRGERAEAVARRFGLPNHGTDLDAPWLREARAVTIGVSPAAHGGVARAALLAGKHVLLEKPMTLHLREAEELVEIAKERALVLAIVHNFQFASSALRLRRLIASGALGEIRGLLCFQASTADRRLPAWYEELPLGLFYDEAPHLLYLLRAFGGDVEVQSVTVAPSTLGRVTPAVLTAHLRAGRVPAVLYNNFEAPVSEWHFTVYGTRAVGIIDVFRDVLVTVPYDGEHRAADVMRTSFAAISSHLAGVVRSGLRMLSGRLLYGNEEIVKRFLDAVETGTLPREISGEDGLAVLRLQHRIIAEAHVLPDQTPTLSALK
jgi:scyllo-inositol 2-dehydrogenase (NADP+)